MTDGPQPTAATGPARPSSPSADSKPLHVRVGLPGGTVHTFSVSADARVSAIARLILEQENLDAAATRVRLISSGKLIRDHDARLADVLNDGAFLHCAVSEDWRAAHARARRARARADVRENGADDHASREGAGDSLDGEGDAGGGSGSRDGVMDDDGYGSDEVEEAMPEDGGRYLLSSVDENGDVRIIIPNVSRAFETQALSQDVLSPEEVQLLRRHMRHLVMTARRQRDNNSSPDAADESRESSPSPDTDVALHARLMRTNPDPRLVLTSGADGSSADFLMGCIFGYLLGIIVLVLLLDNNATRRWRVGIVAGVATNCAFGILRSSLDFSSNPPLTAP